ncbi:MAG: septal ring lytic transglycosylase RlpA family protein [bacterium]
MKNLIICIILLTLTGCVSTPIFVTSGQSNWRQVSSNSTSSSSVSPPQNHNYSSQGSTTSLLVRQVYEGDATYYGAAFHGKTTASGETYNMYALTAAHRNLPFGTMVTVTNLENGKSVTVRINDRGPVDESIIIDLSYEAARRIDLLSRGPVKLEIH